MKTLPGVYLIVAASALMLSGCGHKDKTPPAESTPAQSNAAAPDQAVAAAPVAPAAPTAPDAPATSAPAPAPASTDTTATAPAAPAPMPEKFNWPRVFTEGPATLTVYQPQIEQWDGFNFRARFAVSIQKTGQPAPAFGVIWLTATSNVDKDEGVVTLTNLAITKADFPTEPNNAQQYTDFLKTKLPVQSLPIPLAQISNRFQLTTALKQVATQPIKNTPPRIIFSDEPALLITIGGDPVMRPLPATDYNRVFNTNALIVQNAAQGGAFFLRAMGNWYKSDSIEGPWTVDPDALVSLASVEQAAAAIPQIDLINPPAVQNPTAPDIYVSTVPAELIQTKGPADFLPIRGTELLEVKNSDDAIILNLGDQKFYVLISGRWFSSTALTGQPWAYVPGDKLPADFAKIPPNSDKGNVLVSIPGTPEAKEAVIANSIPQTATINRQEASLTVNYDGAPQFDPVGSVPLQYAVNTPTPVIQVTPSSYYAVSNGVWFTAGAPTGPWTVATSVPPVIYTIPVASPVHYVTYVQVYGYTDSVVYVGYTPGYYGTVVAPGGVVVYGSGYVYPPYIGTTVYVAPPPTYGYGAAVSYSPEAGFLFGFAAGAVLGAYLEPHWGCWGTTTYNTTVNYNTMYGAWGHAAVAAPVYGYHGGGYAAAGYNPYNGAWAATRSGAAYNPYTGTYAAGRSGAAYNPYTGTTAAGREGAAYNPYTGTSAQGKEGASYNPYTGNANAGREGSASNQYTGRSVSGQTTASANAYSGNWNANQSRSYNDSQTGASASSSKSASGNFYNGTASSQTDRSGTTANGSSASSTVDKSTGEPTTRSGTTYNANTGQSNSYSHTTGEGTQNASTSPSHAYSSSDGNVYKPSSDGSGGYQKATSSGWQNASHSESQDADRQSRAWGGDSSGGGSSGGDRWGGSGGGGGGRFGGGGGGGGGRSWR